MLFQNKKTLLVSKSLETLLKWSVWRHKKNNSQDLRLSENIELVSLDEKRSQNNRLMLKRVGISK